MTKNVQIRGYFTPLHETTREQAARFVRGQLHRMTGIIETRRPAYIEAHFLAGDTCSDILPALDRDNAEPGEYYAALGSVVRVSRLYTLTDAEANAASLYYLERVELFDLLRGEYVDIVLPGSRTIDTVDGWSLYREEAATC